jgi:2-oxoglutarate ferredoxin oxidoreductase subunit delta
MERLQEAIRVGRINIERGRCKGCKLCINSCPKGLIALDTSLNKQGVYAAYFKGGECSGCTLCALVCPECCIEVYKE